MPKDKRVKGCVNLFCDRNKKHYSYKATDNYCTICGNPLAFVCAECFGPLADEGPEHILCGRCESLKHDDGGAIRHRMKKVGENVEEKVLDAAADGIHAVAKLVGDGAKVAKKKAPIAMDKAEDAAGKTAKKNVSQKKEK